MLRGNAVFVAYTGHLSGHGGVQVCTAEYLDVLRATGLDVKILEVRPDGRICTRLARRVIGSPYYRPVCPASRKAIEAACDTADFVFLNQMCLAGALPPQRAGKAAIIALSHGCEITDLMHLVRLRREMPLSTNQLRPTARLALARTLADETLTRTRLDGVVTISPFDADCERWLGSKQVTSLPRCIAPAPVVRVPVMGRFGYVGTLDHAPNLEGLVRVLEELEARPRTGIVVRIVGGPERIGHWLTGRFRHVEYLGRLSHTELLAEAATWNGFIHPIFCLPRGGSTKLADGLAWNLPVVTTAFGRRGYEWADGELVEAEDPVSFVAAMADLGSPGRDAEVAAQVGRVALSAPRVENIARRLAGFLSPGAN